MANIRVKPLSGLLGDVRRTNNFIVTIEGVTTADNEEDNNLELIIKQAFIPSVSLNVLELRHGNDAKKFAGVATWTGGQLTVIDVLSPKELQAVLAWFKQTYDWKTGNIGVANDYKKTGYITEYASNGKFVRTWEIEGMWISELNMGELDASSGEMKQVTMTIQIDPSQAFAPTYSEYGLEADDLSTNPLND